MYLRTVIIGYVIQINLVFRNFKCKIKNIKKQTNLKCNIKNKNFKFILDCLQNITGGFSNLISWLKLKLFQKKPFIPALPNKRYLNCLHKRYRFEAWIYWGATLQKDAWEKFWVIEFYQFCTPLGVDSFLRISSLDKSL